MNKKTDYSSDLVISKLVADLSLRLTSDIRDETRRGIKSKRKEIRSRH